MTDSVCTRCSAPVDSTFLCRTCTDRLHRLLVELAGHAADLTDVVITRQTSRRGERVQVRGSTEKPLPYDDDAAEVAWVLHSDLAATVTSLCEDRGITYNGVDTAAALAGWLSRNVASIALAPDALETFDIVEHVHGLVVRTVDVPPVKVWIGRCDAIIDGHRCGDDIRAEEGRETVRCSCMTDYRVDDFRLAVLTKARGYLGTAAELADMLPRFLGKPLTRKRITYYGEQGLVRRIDHAGEVRYQLGEVVDTHQAFRDKRRRSDRHAA